MTMLTATYSLDRWLIVGPERSGSTFHKDPNATRYIGSKLSKVLVNNIVYSAWNAVIRGLKYWIMFPTAPGFPPPPGVFVSEDQSEVTSPVSITEWLIGFHAEARKTTGCLEGLCHEGEVVHVPSGWWHLVVNLEPSIAITQNFVPRGHLVDALDFLKYKSDQVSGFKGDVSDPFRLFCSTLQEKHPEFFEEAMLEMNRRRQKKRKWDEITIYDMNGGKNHSDDGGKIGEIDGAEATRSGDRYARLHDGTNHGESCFSFGFGGGDDSDEEIP